MKPILAASIPPSVIVVAIVAVLILFSVILFILSRYRRCPSDKVMVIYGKVGTNKDGTARSAKCIHGGAAFIKPIVQARTSRPSRTTASSTTVRARLWVR